MDNTLGMSIFLEEKNIGFGLKQFWLKVLHSHLNVRSTINDFFEPQFRESRKYI